MEPEKRLYIAYGSNLNLTDMMRRCPGASVAGTADLRDYELLFRGHANVEPREGSTVPVAVWEIGPEEEKRLDWYEAYPRYYNKEMVDVELESGTVSAMVYTMNPGRPPSLPDPDYLIIIEEGYESFGFDTAVLDQAVERTKELVQEMEQAGGAFPSMKL